MPSKILNFSTERLITGINIVDDMLFYTDNETEPKKINLNKFRGDSTTGEFLNVNVDHSSGTTHIYGRPFEERDITVIKDIPIQRANSQPLTESFGNADSDIKTSDISKDTTESFENNVPIKNADKGVTKVVMQNPIISDTTFIIQNTAGNTEIDEVGVIYSQTETEVEEIVNKVGSASKEIKSVSTGEEDKIATKVEIPIQSTDSTSPNYDADLTTGTITAVPFIKPKGTTEKIFGDPIVKEVFNPASTGVAPSNLYSLPFTIDDNANITLKATLGNNGGTPINEAGFYISKPKINLNDTPPTVQDLIDHGTRLSIANPASDLEEFSQLFKPVAGMHYYFVPFVSNLNFTTYGDDLTLSDTVVKTAKKFGMSKNPINTMGIVDFTSTSIVLQQQYNGDDYLSDFRYPPTTERGFYFSVNKDNKLDILLTDFNSNGASADNKTFKIPLTGDPTEGGIFELDTTPYVTLTEGDSVSYFAYVINSEGAESRGGGKSFELNAPNQSGSFGINDIRWKVDKSVAANGSGTFPLLLDVDLNLYSLGYQETLKDVGLIISKPTTKEEIAEYGAKWTTAKQMLDANNSFVIKKSLNDFTFTAQGSSASIGQYTINNIQLDALTEVDYENYIDAGKQIPLYPDFPYTVLGFVTTDRGTTYSRLKPKFPEGEVNKQLDDKEKSIIGGPRVKSFKEDGETTSALTSSTATINGQLSKDGKNLLEVGFYYSTTKPADSKVLPDGRSPGLDAWSATATKAISSSLSLANANTHVNQTTGTLDDWVDFSSDLTGLTPGTKYYYVAFSKPIQTTNSRGDKVINNAPSFNSLINNIKWGKTQEFVTDKALTSIDSDPILRIHEIDLNKDLTKTSVRPKIDVINTSQYGRVKEIGVYAKPKSLFPASGTDPASQATNAATMANSSNRLSKSIVRGPFASKEVKDVDIELGGLSAVDYFVSAYCITETNGNDQTFISDYIQVSNSVNASPKRYHGELRIAGTGQPQVGTKAWRNKSRNNPGYKAATKEIRTTVRFKQGFARRPQIVNFGYYFIEKAGLAKPANSTEFLAIYDPANAQANFNLPNTYPPASVQVDSNGVSSHKQIEDATQPGKGLGPHFSLVMPFSLSRRFPGRNPDSNVYAMGFYESLATTGNPSDPNEFIYSDIQKFKYVPTISGPSHGIASEGIYRIAAASVDAVWFNQNKGEIQLFSGSAIKTSGYLKNSKIVKVYVDLDDSDDFIMIQENPAEGKTYPDTDSSFLYRIHKKGNYIIINNPFYWGNKKPVQKNASNVIYIWPKGANVLDTPPVDMFSINIGDHSNMNLPDGFAGIPNPFN